MVIAAADRHTGKMTLRRAHGQRRPLSLQFKPGRFSTKTGAIELRDVVVYVDGRTENTGTLEFAAALAFEHGAHLVGVFIQPELALSRAEMFVRGKGIEDVVAALPLLARADAVEILVVDRNGHFAGHGEEPGADVARHLARHGVRVEVRRLSSGGKDVGRLLLSRAAGFSADLIVMGAYGHSHLSEWIFGGVTRTVLREAEFPILISR